MLRIHLILMRIRILDPHWKKRIRIQVISLRFTDFFFKIIFKLFCFIFFAYFYPLKLEEPFRNKKFLLSLFFSKVRIWVFFQFGSGSVDLHIFAIRIQEAEILRIQRILRIYLLNTIEWFTVWKRARKVKWQKIERKRGN